MPIAFDYFNKIIQITSPDVNVDGQTLHDAIEDEMATPVGMGYPDDGTYTDWAGLIRPEGKIDVDPTNPGTLFSQIIIILHPLWQIQFWSGSGVSRLRGATITGGVSNNPVKASGNANDITYFQSPVDGAVVQTATGGTITPGDIADIADAVWDEQTSGHTTNGTFGKFVQGLLTVGKFLGLK